MGRSPRSSSTGTEVAELAGDRMGIERYVLRGLRGNRSRYVLAVVAALLTVAMMVMAGILVRSLQQDIALDVTADVGMDLLVTKDLSTTPTDPFFDPTGPR